MVAAEQWYKSTKTKWQCEIVFYFKERKSCIIDEIYI